MASDRARVTYDPSRQYRSIVMQQGRVTLEADVNEATMIAGEVLREETLDFVGPAGTPDDGYLVSGTTSSKQPFDFHVGPGTMYVGGERSFLSAGIDYSTQPEWQDRDSDALWIDLTKIDSKKNEAIELFLREQEISAIEDQTLREVALGGPDTSQRTRLIQRVLRFPVNSTTCPDAAKEVDWAGLGVGFDPSSIRLVLPATLQVQFMQQTPSSNPCDPPAQSGYLGADNQLIRVQISKLDKGGKGGSFVWGYNNSSFLYRVKVTDTLASPTTLELQSTPVDSYHAPNQTVEVLRSSVSLGQDNFIAAHSGFVDTPTKPYVPEKRQLTLSQTLPKEYLNSQGQLFLRLWQDEINFTDGAAIELPSTGLTVKIKFNGPAGPLTIGQYWMFAVRPGTSELYPQRYIDAAQQPDGPRLWACPLAVIDWNADNSGTFQFNLLEDCRQKFDNLVELTKRKPGQCCSVVLSPDDVTRAGGIQSVLDANKGITTISLKPGKYVLPRPLRIDVSHPGLTFEGCQDGVFISADAAGEKSFIDGMVILDGVKDVTLRNLTFNLPLLPFIKSGGKLAGAVAPLSELGGPDITNLQVGIGVRILGCNGLHLDQCEFVFQQPPPPPPPPSVGFGVFEAGILGHGVCDGLEISQCRFAHALPPNPVVPGITPVTTASVGASRFAAPVGNTNLPAATVPKQAPLEMRIGILLTPTTVINIIGIPGGPGVGTVAGDVLPTFLSNANVHDNDFSGLDAAAAIYANMTSVRVQDNTTENCYAGFWFMALKTLSSWSQLADLRLSNGRNISDRYFNLLVDPVAAFGLVVGRGYPLPAGFDATGAGLITKASGPFNIPIQFPPKSTDAFKPGYILHYVLAAVEQAAFAKINRTTPLALLASGNQIDALEVVNPANLVPVGVRFLIWDDFDDEFGAVVFSSNEIRNQQLILPLPTVGILLVARVTVTGNIVLNEGNVDAKTSLAINQAEHLTSRQGTAVTGNIFRGEIDVPKREGTLTPPLNDWATFNTIVG